MCFPEYNGPQTYEECAKYMQLQFEKRNKASDPTKGTDVKKIYTHITCATDRNNVHMVFNAVKDIIIRASLEAAGLVCPRVSPPLSPLSFLLASPHLTLMLIIQLFSLSLQIS